MLREVLICLSRLFVKLHQLIGYLRSWIIFVFMDLHRHLRVFLCYRFDMSKLFLQCRPPLFYNSFGRFSPLTRWFFFGDMNMLWNLKLFDLRLRHLFGLFKALFYNCGEVILESDFLTLFVEATHRRASIDALLTIGDMWHLKPILVAANVFWMAWLRALISVRLWSGELQLNLDVG